MGDNARALGRFVRGLQLSISDKDAQIRDLQQALRTERDARKAAEERAEAYRELYEQGERALERLALQSGLRVPEGEG